ncbi:MAG: hypothetical protein ACO36I_23495, partial [Candidatus Latescibacterota bacterium]
LKPEKSYIETDLSAQIFEKFDPAEIAEDNLDSLYRRQMINQAQQTNNVSWAHTPTFNPNKNAISQYLL